MPIKSYKTFRSERTKEGAIHKEEHDLIIQKAYNSKHQNGLAFDIARNLGLRVGEIAKMQILISKEKQGIRYLDYLVEWCMVLCFVLRLTGSKSL